MDYRKIVLLASMVVILMLSVIEFLPVLSEAPSSFFSGGHKRSVDTMEPSTIHPFQWWDYVILSIMLAVSAGMGLYHAFAGGGQRTTSRFLMAERSMHSLPVAISVLASYLSAITILGFPSEVYTYGIQYWIVAGSFFIVIPICATIFIPVFHGLGVTSAYEYLNKRFSMTVRTCVAMVFIFQTLLYVAIVLYAPSIALNTVTSLPPYATFVTLGVLCTIYTALGGIKAVIWTDVFQFLVLIGSLIAVAIKGTIEAGGISNVWNVNKNNNHLNFIDTNPDPTERLSLWSLIIGGALNALPIWAVSQTSIQRFLTSASLKEAKKSVWYGLPGNLFVMTLVSFIGLILFAFYYDHTKPKTETADQILVYFVSEEMPAIQGLFVACLFAGTLSTVASGLNSLAAVTLVDIVKPWRSQAKKTELLLPLNEEEQAALLEKQDYRDTILSKIFTLVYGIGSIFLAFLASHMGSLVQMANTIFGSVGGPILGVFSLGMLYKRANSGGALIGLLAGFYMGLWISIGGIINKAPDGTIPDDAFWLYRISFMWYSAVSSMTTVIIGIITSEIVRWSIPDERYRQVDPLLLAPFLRPKGWHKSVTATESHNPSVVIGQRVIPTVYGEVYGTDGEENMPVLYDDDEEERVPLQLSEEHQRESLN